MKSNINTILLGLISNGIFYGICAIPVTAIPFAYLIKMDWLQITVRVFACLALFLFTYVTRLAIIKSKNNEDKMQEINDELTVMRFLHQFSQIVNSQAMIKEEYYKKERSILTEYLQREWKHRDNDDIEKMVNKFYSIEETETEIK